MSDVVSLIIDNSKKESDLEQLRKTLENNIDKLRNSASMLTGALQVLDPEKHSLGMIYLLFAKATLPQVDQSFVLTVENLLLKLNGKQARKCPERFAFVVHRYSDICRDNGFPMRGIRTIQTGIEKFRLNADYLTPLHSDLLCLCLKVKNYKAGYNLIEQKIFDIDPNITGLTPRDMLLYYYYGGMIYTGLKQYEKAQRFFDNCLTVPAFALDAIMVEAFKKYVLVSLLVNGKFLGISKHASSIVHRHMKAYCSQYVDYANAFGDGDIEKVLKVANDHAEVFNKDNNLGLVKQCINALYRRNIQKLTETYMTLSLADIAKTVKLQSAKEAEALLLKMIENGEVNAVINQKDGMVSFEEEIQTFDSPLTGAMLDERIAKSINLANKLKGMDDEIATSHTYVARLHGVHEHMLEFGMAGRGMMGMFPGSKFGKMFDFFGR